MKFYLPLVCAAALLASCSGNKDNASTSGAAPTAAEPVETPGGSSTAGRTPTPDNGHVRDVNASTPPKPDSGSNFTPQGDVHEPKA